MSRPDRTSLLPFRSRRAVLAQGLLAVLLSNAAFSQEPPSALQREALFAQRLSELRAGLPTAPEQFDAVRAKRCGEVCRLIDAQCAQVLFGQMQRPEEWLERLRSVTRAKQEVDAHRKRVGELRYGLADLAASPQAVPETKDKIRSFLRISADLIDLSGRLNFQLRDGVIFASMAAAPQQDLRQKLIDQIDADQSTIGAAMLAPLLIDPPKDSPNRAVPATPEAKQKVLLMLGLRGGHDVLPAVVRFLKSPDATPNLTVLAADTIVRLGLPQPPVEPIPESDKNAFRPIITAPELVETLKKVDAKSLTDPISRHQTTLTGWLERRGTVGVTSAGYWDGSCTIQPGDWLLMRNSSPYNLFTDLSPGLFTHVGVATLHKGADGVQRMVVVDLNERETVIRPRNVEFVLSGSLYYAVLRHEDLAVAKKMAEVAASLINNPMKFDLTFETTRAAALKGKPLTGTKIETYCAGLLLICSQETELPRSEFFPIPENSAPGKTAENMDRIGLRVGDDFISPTGPLFARRMKLIHFSEPMFDPRREIEQRVYDHFAERLATAVIEPKKSLYQSLRQQLAEASRENPVLAKAIADAAGVDRETDLAKAARAAAVVETLDEVAYGASEDFRDTMIAFRAGPLDDRAKSRFSADEIERLSALRTRHADLYQRLERRQISPRELTETLIAFYVNEGRQQIDRYFFSSLAPAPAASGP